MYRSSRQTGDARLKYKEIAASQGGSTQDAELRQSRFDALQDQLAHSVRGILRGAAA
ncbi:MAG: hypothetical protein JWN04_764 [Myxococcaceae bacterium]|nr:hypothetical protein [Myxococcaceae bacterium]